MPTSRIADWVFAALLLWVAGSAHAAGVVVPNAAWLLHQVKILTAPDMEGRGSGTAGAARAARHIAAVFALRGQRAGQRVEIVVVRDKQQHRMEAVLQERR